jgi:DNA repair exonuclease SbcCD ATPase subunit
MQGWGKILKNLNIKYLYAQNFLCFGKESFELNLEDLGNVILVKGSNLDVSEDDESSISSNGAGKSSIPEILVYTLFGKTIKHPKKINHKDVINNQIGKALKTEVKWGDFRVVRTRKPDSLKIWESSEGKWDESTEITLGGQPATQKLIEEKLGLNYETFVNVVVFTDNNAGSFLECDSMGKRDIVENLLSLEKYKDFSERAKNLKKEKKDEIKIAQHDYESARLELSKCESRIKATKEQEDSWRNKRKDEIESLKSRIKLLEKELNSTPEGEKSSIYKNAQERISELNSLIEKLETNRSKIQEILDGANEKISSLMDKKSHIQSELSSNSSSMKSLTEKILFNKNEIKRLEGNEGIICKFCLGKISKKNYQTYTDRLESEISDFESQNELLKSEISVLSAKMNLVRKKETSISEASSMAKSKLSSIAADLAIHRKEISELNKIEKPESKDTNQKLLEQQIESLANQISDKSKEISGESPFKKIMESLKDELSEKKSTLDSTEKTIDSLEGELPYYEFWSVAFGDSGIRKFVIDGIIPALNARIAYWMQFLIDGKIKLEFDNELEERIERNPSDGDPFVYYGMSGGEKRRLNLAVSQAFAHVMMLNSGSCPSVVFLDEVTTNIDQMGVVGVYNMITELAKDRQVFITTHDQNLLDMLNGCELINLEKRKGFTHLKK